MTANEMAYYRGLRDLHDPSKQGHGYTRCEHCNFIRHPCDTFDLAETAIKAVEERDEARFLLTQMANVLGMGPGSWEWTNIKDIESRLLEGIDLHCRMAAEIALKRERSDR